MIQTVDLNLSHYIGKSADVLRKIKSNIRTCLRSPEFPSSENINDITLFLKENYKLNPNITLTAQNIKQIYSAIYNSITYYQNIVESPVSREKTSSSFLEQALFDFNQEYKRLSDKYDSPNIYDEKIITAKGRIKSPISAIDKIISKCAEYINDGMDLQKINGSLRDFIGFRIIINPPQEIKAQGKQAESDFIYTILYDFITNNTYKSANTNLFLPVNTEHDPQKLEKIKERPIKEGFNFDPEEAGVFIPKSRPEYIEKYDKYIKDYSMYPKKGLYQRKHLCLTPNYTIEGYKESLPKYIIPSSSNIPAIEYQFCSKDEETFAEQGIASHLNYKIDRSFHRLRIPYFIEINPKTNQIQLSDLDKSMQSFFGYSFKEKFGIPYQTFLSRFNSYEKDLILAEKIKIIYDPETNDYSFKNITYQPILPYHHAKQMQKDLQTKSLYERRKILDSLGLLKNSIYPNGEIISSQIDSILPVFISQCDKEQQTEQSKNNKQK